MHPIEYSGRLPARAAALLAVFIAAASTLVAPQAGLAQSTPEAPAAAAHGANAYRAGGLVRITSAIDRDLMAAGGRILVEQRIGGDATLAAGSVELRAPVSEDLRLAAGHADIESAVGGELFAASGNVTIGRGASIASDATVYAGELTLQGRIDRNITARARRIVIDGEIKGDADLAAEDITLGPSARIGGSLNYAMRGELNRAAQATVGGTVTRSSEPGGGYARGPRVHDDGWGAVDGRAGTWGSRLVFFVGVLATAALLQLLAPGWTRQAAQRVGTDPLPSLGVGVLALLMLPVIGMLLMITILGIPLAMVLMMLYPVLMLTGFVLAAFGIAALLGNALRTTAPASYAATMGLVALALLLLLLASRIPLIGWLAFAVAVPIGLGAAVLDVRDRWRGRRGAAGGRDVTVA